ncbi:MAG: hypothetical protein K2K70_00475 [Lachnospiraceae bacterium]|nr:hypothetical protein [Lachnospiraceae bacterium]
MSMLIEICKYDRDWDDFYAELLMNEIISSEDMYYKYLDPAIKELRIQYFRNDGEIRKCNQEAAMREVELLIEWVENHVEGEDLEYLKSRLQRVHEFIPEALQEDDDILHIF